MIKLFLLNIIILLNIILNEKFGLKVALKPDLIQDIKEQYADLVFEKLRNHQFDTFTINKDNIPLFKTIKADFINPTANFTKYNKEKINFNFLDSNVVNLQLQDLDFLVYSDVQAELGVYNESFYFQININVIEIEANINLIKIESKLEKGKYLPGIQLLNTKVNLDFDLNITSKSENKNLQILLEIFKNKLKEKLSDLINNKIPTVIPLINENLIVKLAELPYYYNIYKRDDLDILLDFDYSLTKDFETKNNILIVSLNSTFFDELKPETKIGQYEYDITLKELSQKSLQVFLTDYNINSNLATIFEENLMNFKINTEEIKDKAPDLPVLIDTSSLDPIFKGLVTKYGEHKEVEIMIETKNAPLIKFNEGSLEFNFIQTAINLNIFIDKNKTERALRFLANIKGSFAMEIASNFTLKGKLINLKFSDFEAVEKNIPECDLEDVEQFLNYLVETSSKLINENIASVPLNITNYLPKNLEINDLAIKLYNNYIMIDANPRLKAPFSFKQEKEVLTLDFLKDY